LKKRRLIQAILKFCIQDTAVISVKKFLSRFYHSVHAILHY